MKNYKLLYDSVQEIGVDKTAEKYGVGRETVRREVRRMKAEVRGEAGEPVGAKREQLYNRLSERFSDVELEAIASGIAINPHNLPRPAISFDGEDVVIGFVTDTHVGDESFSDYLWESFLEECEKEKVTLILHAGDVHEGMSHRPDQIYHLTDIGVSAQMNHVKRLFSMTDIPIKVIDGNHDRWGIKSNGLYMVREVANSLKHVEYLGCDTGYLSINGSKWELFHGEDFAGYATSYRLQQMAGAFTGGNKPQVLLCGHTHKQGYFFERNIHIVSGGALSYQSAWMQSTRKACHTGFWIIRATIRDGSIVKFCPTWYPFYR